MSQKDIKYSEILHKDLSLLRQSGGFFSSREEKQEEASNYGKSYEDPLQNSTQNSTQNNANNANNFTRINKYKNN